MLVRPPILEVIRVRSGVQWPMRQGPARRVFMGLLRGNLGEARIWYVESFHRWSYRNIFHGEIYTTKLML